VAIWLSKKRKKEIIAVVILVLILLSVIIVRIIGQDDTTVPTLIAEEESGVAEESATKEESDIAEEPAAEEESGIAGQSDAPEYALPPEEEIPVYSPASAREPADQIIDIAHMYPYLKEELDIIALQYNCVAISLVFFDGDIGEYYAYQYGYADLDEKRVIDADTKFRVASLSKLVTAVCAMVLVDEGKLDLDEDISKYLGYEVKNPEYPDTPITSRMLMQHMSSIFDSSAFHSSLAARVSESTQNLLEKSSSFRKRQPGTQFEYTNLGYSVLAAICEKLSEKMLDTLARDVIFDPLEIDAAYVSGNLQDKENIAVIYNSVHKPTRAVEAQLEITDSGGVLGHDHHLAQGGLVISAIDYAGILSMLGNDGIFHDVRILSPDSVRAINNTNAQGRAYKQGLATRYSFGVFMPDEGSYWHTGSAYGTFAQYIYSADGTNRGVVVITTGATTGRLSNRMFEVCTDLSRSAWEYLTNT